MDKGYTLVETSVAVTISLIVFGAALQLAAFANRIVSDSMDRSVGRLELRLLSDRVANDLRNARDVRIDCDTTTIYGQNSISTLYQMRSGRLFRNGIMLGSSIQVRNLHISKIVNEKKYFVEYTIVATLDRDSSKVITTLSGVFLRGAPIWPGDTK